MLTDRLSPNTPVLIGVGLTSQREEDPQQAKEPLDLMIEAVRAAAADAGAPDLLSEIQRIYVPQGRWSYSNPGGLIRRHVGARHAKSVLAKIGILQQTLIGEACQRIAEGDIDSAAVVGGEAGYRMLRAAITGKVIVDAQDEDDADELMQPHDEMRNSVESRAGLSTAVGFYAIIESAYRAAHGWRVREHRERIASLYADFSEIASQNPHAWRRDRVSAQEICDPSPRNPMLAFPYTKLHVSSWNVDQASAVLLCSAARAKALSVPPAKWILPIASTESNFMMDVSERPAIGDVPGADIAGKLSLDLAGTTADELDLVELYSCFPVAVEVYAEALGVPIGRSDLTVTGGMAFAGGPLNNYVIHATCQMAEKLRDRPGCTGLVSSVSGLLTKQGFGVWTSALESAPTFAFRDVTATVRSAVRLKQVRERYAGPGTIAGYTVLHERSQPSRAVAIVDVDERCRTVAFSQNPGILADMESDAEFVGRQAVISLSGQFSL